MGDFTFFYPREFELESGQSLPSFELAYSTFGQLNEDASNVVWVCHAFTGHPNVMNWWEGLFGKGKFFDPEKYFIICANMLGSCYGSTGPLSIHPATKKPWFHDFPLLTNRDVVRAFELLRNQLGIEKIHVLMGGSMGGQQVLEWAWMKPDIFDYILPIATNAQHSPWGIAFNESQRMAIEADQSWKESKETAGLGGMKAARAMAMHSYRSYEGYKYKQSEEHHDKIDGFRAASYQQYMGKKLAQRFNAFTYWTLSKAMDSHDLARGRGSLEEVLSKIRARALCIAFKGDLLFPPAEQRFLADHMPEGSYHEVRSPFGHDGFLVEFQALDKIFRKFLVKNPDLLKK